MTDEIKILEAQIATDIESLEKDREAGLFPAERVADFYEALVRIKDKQIELWQLTAKDWANRAEEALESTKQALALLTRLEALVEGQVPDEGSENNPLGGTAERVDIEREKEMTA